MSGTQGQQATHFDVKRWWLISLIVFVTLFITAVCLWKLSDLGIFPKPLASVLNPIFVVTITIFTASLTFLTAINNLFPLKSLFLQTKPPQQKFNKILWPLPSIDFSPSPEREDEIEKVYQELLEPDVTALVITGGDGTGKSKLASLICRYAEEQQLIFPHNPFAAKPLWLRINSNITTIDLAGTLFEALGKRMPADFNKLSLFDQASELHKLLNAKNKPRLIVLDQFDRLLHGQTGQVLKKHQAIGLWLELLNSEDTACRLLITSRSRLQIVSPSRHGHIREHKAKNLSMSEGIALLRQRGIQEEDTELIKAVERCEGHASALIYLADMVKKHDLKLANFLNDPSYENLWLGDIASNLLGYLYTRLLTNTQRKLLQAFSIYREAVPLKATQIVIGTFHGQAHDCDVLYDQQLLNVSKGHYQPTAIVAAYVRDHFDERNVQPQQPILQGFHAAAARYYVEEAHTLSTQKQSADKTHLLTEAVWHDCEAGQWQAAYNLIEQNGFFADFKGPGNAIDLLEVYQSLLPSDKWQPNSLQKAHILYNLAMICADLGQKESARIYYEGALSIWNDKGERRWEGVTLSNLGRVYSALGKKSEALDKYEKALDILRDTGEYIWIGTTLSYLGRVYGSLEQYTQAKDAYKRALDILKDQNDRSIESITLSYLGVIYCLLDQKDEGLKSCQDALDMVKVAGDQRAKGRVLNNLGRCYSIQRNYEQAKICYEEALAATREARDRSGEGVVLQNTGNLYNMQGQTDLARIYYEKALRSLTEVGDCWRESIVYNDLGNIYADEKQWRIASENYEKALNIRKAIGDHKGEASTLCNIGKLFLLQKSYEIGIAYLVQARRIFDKIQIPYPKELEDQLNNLSIILGEEQYKIILTKTDKQQF